MNCASRSNGFVTMATMWLCLVGCGSRAPQGPELFSVSGTVTMDGKPLSGAGVAFVPSAGTRGQISHGITGLDGKYTLSVSDPVGAKAGAAAGSYKVVISKQATPDGKPAPTGPDAPAVADEPDTLPKRYSDFLSTELTAEVPHGGTTTANFELKSKP